MKGVIPLENTSHNNRSKLSEAFVQYVAAYKKASLAEEKPVASPVYVDAIVSKVAKAYEALRRIIDWKEEHLVRRSVIERILRRKFVNKIYGISISPTIDTAATAESLVHELILGGYFKNGSIPRAKIATVQAVLEKYVAILNSNRLGEEAAPGKERRTQIKRQMSFYRWLLELASCELEYVLVPSHKEYALLELMVTNLDRMIQVRPEGKLSTEAKRIQMLIAVRKALFKCDYPTITFDLMRVKYPDFFGLNATNLDVRTICEELTADLKSSSASEFYAVAEKYDAAYLLLGDAMDRLWQDQHMLTESVEVIPQLLATVEEVYSERLATLRKRLYGIAVFSTLSIFVAGAASLLLFEIPIASLVRGYFSPWAIVADLAIPTVLMFLLVSIIRLPSKDNLVALKNAVSSVVLASSALEVYELFLEKRAAKVQTFIFTVAYVAGGLVALYFIYWIFKLANVPWTSLYINTANVAMVVFAAMLIKQRANELTMLDRENVLDVLIEPFSTPMARLGLWLSTKWKEYNVISILFGALVDYPFSVFMSFLEGWRSFIKEKKRGLH